ncbi:MAG: hypothetical protein WC707_04470 [Candidatus Babeliaceae bacterium]|jgi:hypothetical protein
MIEQWIRWEPIEGLEKKYCIHSIEDTLEGFSVLLSNIHNKEQKIRIIFENSVDAYRNTHENFRSSLKYALSLKYGDTFYGSWTFFKVTNSLYIQWLFEQSFGTSDSLNFIHFSFIATNSILDIVTNYEPKIELIETEL